MRIAFTGHRPGALSPDFNKAQYLANQFAAELVDRLLKAYPGATMISGMGLGFDMGIANVCSRSQHSWIAAIPFKGQEALWGPEWQHHYRVLLADCPEVVQVSEGGYAPWKLHKRNYWMVDNSDLLIALWSGLPKGGTYATLQYAEKRKRPVVQVWKMWRDMLGELDAEGALSVERMVILPDGRQL